jgi:hypothetical protein
MREAEERLDAVGPAVVDLPALCLVVAFDESTQPAVPCRGG